MIIRSAYEACCRKNLLDPVGDWDYLTVGRSIYMVLYTYSLMDVKKVLSESVGRCGFEGYRLLSRECDPVSTDIAYALLERVLVIARW